MPPIPQFKPSTSTPGKSSSTASPFERPFRNWSRDSQRPPHCFCRPMVQEMIPTSSSQENSSQGRPLRPPSLARSAELRASDPPEDGRLCKHADYQRVYQATRKQFSASMTWFAAMRTPIASITKVPLPVGPRVGLTAGKVLGKAHERNRIKRRMREVVRHHLRELPPGLDLILHPRRSVMNMDFAKLDAEVLRIFRQANAQIAGQTSRKPGTAPASHAPSTAS